MILTKKENSIRLINFLSLFVLLLGLGKEIALAYPKAVKVTGGPSEIEDLIYLELAKKKSPIWYVAPTNVFLTKIVLVPEEDYLVPLYEIKLRYPLKSVLYQSFLEMNLRYLLADQIKALLDYQEQLAKLKAFQKRAKELLGPYLAEVSSSDLGYEEESSSPLPLFEIGSLFSALRSSPGGQPVIPSLGGSGAGGEKAGLGMSRERQPRPRKQEAEEGGEMPGPFKALLKGIFGVIDWLGKNKEILLGVYLLVILFAFLISSAKR